MRRAQLLTILVMLFTINSNVIADNKIDSNTLNVTIIGSGSPQFDPDRAGPSVLINYKDTYIVVDTGNGTQSRFNDIDFKIKELDGILYTHHHLDHNEEFIPVFIRSLLGDTSFTLAGPTPMNKMVSSTLSQYKTDIEYRMRRSGRNLSDVTDNYTVKEVDDKASFSIGEIEVSTTKVNHTIETIAYRFDAGGHSIVISGDLTYSESLVKLAKGADVLVIESGGTIKVKPKKRRNNDSKGSSNKKSKDGHQRAHVTLDETAQMSHESGAKKIVLTHFTNGENDEPATISELSKTYKGEIVFGEDLMVVSSHGQTSYLTNKQSNNKPAATTGYDEIAASRAAKKTDFTVRPTNECLLAPEFKNQVNFSQDETLRYITANAIPDHSIGSFPNGGNPNQLSEQSKRYSISLIPNEAEKVTYLYDRAIDYGRPNYIFGVALNGVKFEPTANEYFYGANGSNYDWTIEALSKEVFLGDDCNNAHVQPNGEYHYHGSPVGLLSNLITTESAKAMVLVGWAADGFPIYYAYGHAKADDSNSQLKHLDTSYQLREGQRTGDGKTEPNGSYSGLYVRDYVYKEGSGDLDQCNGRKGVTPEFPQGTYYYMLTNEFPFVGRCLVGEPSKDFKVGGGNRQSQSNGNQQSQQPARERDNQGRPDSKQIMTRMDRDNDQKISQSEARGRLKENFSRRDQNNDGFITLNELAPSRER